MHSQDADTQADRIQAWMGTAVLACASLMAILIFADRTDAQLFPLPGIWYTTREFHVLLCLTLFLMAAVLLKSPSPQHGSLARPRPRPLFSSVRFFSRQDCPLCDEALDVLLQQRDWLPPLELLDVDAHPDWQRQFGNSVPVVEIDGRIRFRGGVQPLLLQRLIDGRLRQVSDFAETQDDAEAAAGQPRRPADVDPGAPDSDRRS